MSTKTGYCDFCKRANVVIRASGKLSAHPKIDSDQPCPGSNSMARTFKSYRLIFVHKNGESRDKLFSDKERAIEIAEADVNCRRDLRSATVVDCENGSIVYLWAETRILGNAGDGLKAYEFTAEHFEAGKPPSANPPDNKTAWKIFSVSTVQSDPECCPIALICWMRA